MIHMGTCQQRIDCQIIRKRCPIRVGSTKCKKLPFRFGNDILAHEVARFTKLLGVSGAADVGVSDCTAGFVA